MLSRRASSPVIQNRKAQPTQACGISDHVDLDNLFTYDCEIEYKEQLPLPRYGDAYGSVHESRPRSLRPS